MSINAVLINNNIATNTLAKQYQPAISTQATNPFFRKDSLSLGNAGSPYQTYAPPVRASAYTLASASAAAVLQSWRIEDHYPIDEADVQPMVREIYQELKNTDFSGMSSIEKYTYIENKYIEAFGEDFMMADALKLQGEFWRIGSGFRTTLGYHFGGDYEAFSQVNRIRLYGDMSTGEIQELIKAKYPKELTNRELCLMWSEMEMVGVVPPNISSTMLSNYSTDFAGFNEATNSTDKNRWLDALDKKANLSMLFGAYNIAEMSMSGHKMGIEARNFLVNVLGARLNEKGLLEPSYWELVNGDWKVNPRYVTPDLEGSFLEALEQHDASLCANRREPSEYEHKSPKQTTTMKEPSVGLNGK